MISLKKTDGGYLVKFELDYTYPTHKNLINETFSDFTLKTENNITIDLSKVKIIDMSGLTLHVEKVLR